MLDDNYQKTIEEFDRIKQCTADAINQNAKRVNAMKSWKNDIRSTVMKVRDDFVSWVDGFTSQFIRSLKGIDGQGELADLGGFMIDATLRRMLEELRESYVRIMLVFTDVANMSIQEKIENLNKTKDTIKDLESLVKKQDYEIKTRVAQVKNAQYNTVALDQLEGKL
jgi:gas vesicle protein